MGKDKTKSNLEESYEQANVDQTTVIWKTKRKVKPHYGKQTFKGSRKSIAHYTSFRSLVGSARLLKQENKEVRI